MNARVPIKSNADMSPPSAAGGLLQRKCACGGVAGLSGNCEKCSMKRLQRKPAGAEKTDAVPPIVHEVLRSPGEPLDAATRSFMEPRFGHDFSQVRVHTDALAAESARAVNALAYTVGRDVVFAAGRYEPHAARGRKLLAHELTHTIQQSAHASAAAMPHEQIAVGPTDTSLERAAEESAGRLTANSEASSLSPGIVLQRAPDSQAEGEASEYDFKLDESRSADKKYAWAEGRKDAERLKKSDKLSPEFKREIIAKMRFFQGEAKAAYIQMIKHPLADYHSDDVTEILEQASSEPKPPKPSCDLAKRQFLLEYEDDPAKSRCMDEKDPEFNNLFDLKIKKATGYAVEETTWENVEYDSFKVMLLEYRNGTKEYFILNEIGDFHYDKHMRAFPTSYLKRKNGLVYPLFRDRLLLSEHVTPNIVSLKEGLKHQIKELQDLYELLQIAGTFASILGAYGAADGGPGPAFRTSIRGFRRTRSVRTTTPDPSTPTTGKTDTDELPPTPMRLPEKTTKAPTTQQTKQTKQPAKGKGEEARTTVVSRTGDDPTSFKGGKKTPAKKGGKKQKEVRASKVAGKKGDDPEDAKGGKKVDTADEPKKIQIDPKAKPISDEPKPKPEPTEKSAVKPEGVAKMTDAEKAKRLEEIKQERTQNDTKMRELEVKIGEAKERHRNATAKAASAKTEAERNTQLDKARRNKESEQKWKEEQDALRMRNNKLRDEEGGLAPPKLAPKSWPEAEGSLRSEFGGQKKTLSTATKDGDLGERDIDCFTPADKVSREAKFGRQKYSQRLQEEINKDVALKKAGRVSRNEWHFYENPDTGIGPDSTLKRALDAADIKIVIKK